MYISRPMSETAHPKYSRFQTAHFEVQQRKDCKPWKCAMLSLLVKISLELCLLYKPSKKRLHTLRVCDLFFDGKKFLRIMPVLHTIQENISHFVRKNVCHINFEGMIVKFNSNQWRGLYVC